MDEYNTNTNSNEIEEEAVEPTTTEVTVNVTETPKEKGHDIGRKILRGAEAGFAIFGVVTLARKIRDNFRRRRELAAELKEKLKKAKEAPNITEGSAENQ